MKIHNTQQTIILSTITNKVLSLETDKLQKQEIFLLEIINKFICSGSTLEYSNDKKTINFLPSIISNNNGEDFFLDVSQFNVSKVYFLKAIALIALFGKTKLRVTVKGNSFSNLLSNDGNIDIFKTVTLPIIARVVGYEESFDLEIFKRDWLDGRCKMSLPFIKSIESFDYSKVSFIKSVKGLILSQNQHISNLIKSKINDAYSMSKGIEIAADTFRGITKVNNIKQSTAPNVKSEKTNEHLVSISLIAENFNGQFISCQDFIDFDKVDIKSKNIHPNEFSEIITDRIINEFSRRISSNANFDEQHNIILLILASLAENNNSSKILLESLNGNYVSIMKTIKEVSGVKFKISKVEGDEEFVLGMKQQRFNTLKADDDMQDEDQVEGEEYIFKVYVAESVGIAQYNIQRETF